MFRTSSLLLALSLGVAAHATDYSVWGPISGAQENPPTSSTATGTITGSYSTTTKILTLNITVTGLSANLTGRHIHKGAVGVNGPVVVHLMGANGSKNYSSAGMDNFVLTSAQETDLLGGLYYVNFHNSNFPGGEVRGQLNLDVVPEPASMTALAAGALIALRRKRAR